MNIKLWGRTPARKPAVFEDRLGLTAALDNGVITLKNFEPKPNGPGIRKASHPTAIEIVDHAGRLIFQGSFNDLVTSLS